MFITSMENAFSLKGKNAVVTGGNKGIGLGIVTAFAQQGANVAILARDEASGKAVIADLCAKYDGKFVFYKTDITDFQNCKESISGILSEFGNIDVLVNNAGVAAAGKFLDMDEDLSNWYHCIDVDLNGAARMSYLVGKLMRDAGKGGRIINISSNAGEICNKPNTMISYSVAKAGLNRFTKYLAYELAEYGIRVNAIAPGYTYSNLSVQMGEDLLKEINAKIPVGRFGQAIEIGALATYLASDASDILTGAVITIDGGYSLAI